MRDLPIIIRYHLKLINLMDYCELFNLYEVQHSYYNLFYNTLSPTGYFPFHSP
jgi:hypothetical protein